MGCGCGGRRRPSPRSSGLAQLGDRDPRPHEWRVWCPNGSYQDFPEEWIANAVAAQQGCDKPVKVYTD